MTATTLTVTNGGTALPVHPVAQIFPPLSAPELKELADDIDEHGLHEPVWLWRDSDGTEYLLDGRNRVAACEMAGVEVLTRWYPGDDPIAFVIGQNIRRRHLTSGQKDFLALDLEPMYAAQAKERQREAGRVSGNGVAGLPQAIGGTGKARDRAAAAVGASGRGVGQAKRIKDRAPDLSDKVRSGDMPIDRADRILRDREAEERRIARAKTEADAAGTPTLVDIRHGDFRDVLADLTNVDAIICDPPYSKEFLPLLSDLAAWADKVLAPDGVLAVLHGQSHLPEVYRLLDGGRPYRWTGCLLTPGRGYNSFSARSMSTWKPLILFGGGPRFVDVICTEHSDAAAKSRHIWGQDYSAFQTIVERLTERGQTVADPFMGSGTTLLAAHALGRNTVGCDIDAGSVATTRRRLSL
jgi:DNA methylase/Putative RNA methylase family UPF0020